MGLSQLVENEPVRRLALREAIVLPNHTPAHEAVRLMRQKRLGCVIVTNGADQPSGIFTERELLTLLSVSDAMEKPIGDYQTKEFAAVTEDDPIEEVIQAMQAKDQRFVVVIDRSGKAQALTGQKGLMEFIADNFPWQVAVQRVGMGASTMREGA